MKFFLPVVCSLLLIGCSDSTEQSSPSAVPASVQPTALPGQTAPSGSETTVETNTSTSLPAPTAASVDGAALFAQKCAACHGSKAEKSALNKSQVIARFSEQQIKEALHGYQAGTYGKEMKAMMQGQAKPLSDEQIDALAQSIPHL